MRHELLWLLHGDSSVTGVGGRSAAGAYTRELMRERQTSETRCACSEQQTVGVLAIGPKCIVIKTCNCPVNPVASPNPARLFVSPTILRS